jgi:dTMP kinase
MPQHKTIPGGLFVSFEGPECSGKSTQSAMLSKVLKGRGCTVLETREPGGTQIGEEIRHMVKHVCGKEAVCDEAELLLFNASRAQLTRKIIMPVLDDGGVVICDRYADSTTAYQGYGRGFDLTLINQLHAVGTAGRWPDITFLLDLEVIKVLARGQMRLETLLVEDRIEDESQAFHETVRKGYLKIAEANPDRIVVIEADQDRDVIHQTIMEHITRAIERICCARAGAV